MAPSSAGLFTLVASCLLLWRCSAARKMMVVLHHNSSNEGQQLPVAPQAVCPELCRCYINILSCHPAKPVDSHSHDAATGLLEPDPTDDSGKSPHSKNHNTTEEESTDILTEVPQGIRGTTSGNVLTPFSVLNLKGNRITDLIPETFDGLSHLKYLFLSYNQIRFIADYMFQPTPEIELIDISNNHLYAIQRDLFRTKHGLPSLKVLDLSNNNILILGPGAFSQLSSLHFLNVSDNYLSLIGDGAFDHLSSIIYLDLRATSISLDILKGILESTLNIVNLYISHTLKCCLCKYPQLDKLILARNVEINCKNIFCTISLMQCYTKEVKKQTILKDKERIIEEMEAVKASAITSLSGKRNGDGPQNIADKLERSRHPEPRIMSAARVQPELGLEILNKDLQLGDKQAELKEEIFNKNLEIKNKIQNEQSTRDAEREILKQYNIAKLSSASRRPELPASGSEENTLGRLHKLKEALKSLYHYASRRIANRDDNQFTVKLES
ncbi:leucine-rich repeat-containing protein 37A3-like isoform X2 [Scyliorhinus canicula]|uniref:leucine-rich repeat-containing protein 37A3-like isoform X2 n=1 Tax=Scyliorhinus canicula TaxID=7830 RepID=UPI0018F7A686|nr:leucine-rich repeat-containing protein 37A3-like isoform X2 [Scyliorhinus canicula]